MDLRNMDVFQLCACAQFACDHIWVTCKLLAEIFGRRMWSEEEAIAICWINCVITDLMFTSTQLMHSQSMQNLFILFSACAYDLFSVHIFQRPAVSLQRDAIRDGINDKNASACVCQNETGSHLYFIKDISFYVQSIFYTEPVTIVVLFCNKR